MSADDIFREGSALSDIFNSQRSVVEGIEDLLVDTERGSQGFDVPDIGLCDLDGVVCDSKREA